MGGWDFPCCRLDRDFPSPAEVQLLSLFCLAKNLAEKSYTSGTRDTPECKPDRWATHRVSQRLIGFYKPGRTIDAIFPGALLIDELFQREKMIRVLTKLAIVLVGMTIVIGALDDEKSQHF
jgi:hypothetical protein